MLNTIQSSYHAELQAAKIALAESVVSMNSQALVIFNQNLTLVTRQEDLITQIEHKIAQEEAGINASF
jgi:hypothetical protein